MKLLIFTTVLITLFVVVVMMNFHRPEKPCVMRWSTARRLVTHNSRTR